MTYQKKTRKCIIAGLILLALIALPGIAGAQLFYNNGATVYVNTNAIVQVNGDLANAAVGTLTNQGDVTITGYITNDATAGGDGDFHVAGNFTNNSTFNGATGSVELNGAAQQVAGTQSTHFYDLLLTGSNVKTLVIDAYVNNLLALNDRELATNANTMFVEATATTAITRTTGFVSSLAGGTLSRKTLAASVYTFPVGSSVGTLRYRPVNIDPASAAPNTYTVRMANVDATGDGFDRTLIDSTICEANPNFYHLIDRTAGTDAADIGINFDVSDGNWEGIANWVTASTEWQTIGPVTVAGSYVTRVSWNTYTYEPYILTKYKSNAQITYVPPVCENSNTLTLDAVDNGGTWTGSGITSGSAGTFDPGVGAGDHIVTYTIAGTCGDVDNTTIHVNDVADITSVSVDESCIGASDGSINISVIGGTQPFTFSWDNSASTEDITGLTPGSYIVNVSDANNCAVTQSFNILGGTSECVPESFYIPNIFSPNGDLINDVFIVRGHGIKTFSIVIFDRWGEKVFETSDPFTPWDGTFRGKPMGSAVFMYHVDAEMNSGTIYKEKGSITLVR